jgi:hypothetical protein
MVEQSPEKTCATWFKPRLHHKDIHSKKCC